MSNYNSPLASYPSQRLVPSWIRSPAQPQAAPVCARALVRLGRHIPRARIAHRTPTRALARAAELLRQALRGDLLQQRVLVGLITVHTTLYTLT